MHFLGGMHCFLCLKLNCLVFNLWKTCIRMIWILLKYLLHVKSFLKMVTIGIMNSCLKQINCVCLSVPLKICLWLNHMRGVWWVILGFKRLCTFCKSISFSLKWNMMCISFVITALCVNRINLRLSLMDYILLCMFLNILGLTFLWTLLWGCQKQRMERILCLWLLTGFLKWHTSYLARRWMMLVMWLNYFSRKYWNFMDY